MKRRGFLNLLGAVAAGAAFDPERLLWVPGAKTISIPRARAFVPDTIRVGDCLLIDGALHVATETVEESDMIDLRVGIYPSLWRGRYGGRTMLMSDAIRARDTARKRIAYNATPEGPWPWALKTAPSDKARFWPMIVSVSADWRERDPA